MADGCSSEDATTHPANSRCTACMLPHVCCYRLPGGITLSGKPIDGHAAVQYAANTYTLGMRAR